MSDTKVFTAEEVATKTDRKECYVIIDGKVYDSSKFIDEHPGGIEVILDVGGQDATEAFEDVGHSDEAREILKTLQIGTLKDAPKKAVPKNVVTPKSYVNDAPGAGTLSAGSFAISILALMAAYFVYMFLMSKYS